jgi:CCR4-NOT transcriptional regulation complex NOT5 subunit
LPGPWRLDAGAELDYDDRVKGIKEAIDILQQELADLEAIEQKARIERLVPALDTR